MYTEQFGDVVISECVTVQGGALVSAYNTKNNMKIFMDVSEDVIPDGQAGYLFGNKLIITVHWSGLEDGDIEQLFNGVLKLRIGLLQNGLFMFIKFGSYNWGDVVLLPGIISSMNDFNRTFDEVIVVVVDSSTSKIAGTRNFPLNKRTADFVANGNKVSYNYFHQNGTSGGQYNGIRELFDEWSSLTAEYTNMVFSLDPEEVAVSDKAYGIDVDAAGNARFTKN